MAENSAIEWTDATVNFWWGCTKVGPGCDHCYAETWSKRTGQNLWGVGAPRREIKGANKMIIKMDDGAVKFQAKHGRRRRVFVQSMSDLFDNEVPQDWFVNAWLVLEMCKNLDIQIVTKRISNVEKRFADRETWAWPKHVGLMVTVCNQEEADRDVPRLLALKAKLGIPWVGLSIEPLLGPIDLRNICTGERTEIDALTGFQSAKSLRQDAAGGTFEAMMATIPPYLLPQGLQGIDWAIVGGESGSGARPMHPAWVRAIRNQCAAAGVPFLFKQWGQWHADALLYTDMEGRCPPPDMSIGKKRAGRVLDGVEHNGYPRTGA